MDLFTQEYNGLPGYPAAWSDEKPDPRYRYALWRIFTPHRPRRIMSLIGLNPSTATEMQDDPTVNRCWKLAQREGMDALIMLNLFAWRSTDPYAMKKTPSDPIGPENNHYLKLCTSMSDLVVAAWGIHGEHMGRGDQVKALIPNLMCLGITKDGHPKHPLYLAANTKLVPFQGGVE